MQQAGSRDAKSAWMTVAKALLNIERRAQEVLQGERQRREDSNQYLDQIANIDPLDAMIKYQFFLLGLILAGFSVASIVKFGLSFQAAGWLGRLFALASALSIARFLTSARMDARKRLLARDKARKVIETVLLGNRTLPKAEEIRLPESYLSSGYQIYDLEDGIGCWSTAISDALVSKAGAWRTRLDIREGMFLGGGLRSLVGFKTAFERLSAGKPFRNESKIRLLSDVLLEDGQLPHRILVQRTDYVANISTNDLAFCKVKHPISLATAQEGHKMADIYDGESFFLGSNRTFLGFGDSLCSNQLGVSLLAFTDDRYMVRVLQQPVSQHSPGMVAPSGSGSFDWEDLSSIEDHPTGFWGWASSHLRELLEELGLDQRSDHHGDIGKAFIRSLNIRSIPIGFGCYLHRSGNPEIICLTQIYCDLENISKHCQYTLEEEKYSRIFSQGTSVRVNNFDIESLRLFLSERMREEEKSVPLEMGYRMLLHLCDSKPLEIEAFLKA